MRTPGDLSPRHDARCQILAWAVFDGTGTPRITDGLHALSVSDDGVGLWTVTWSQAISSSTAYAVTGLTRTPNSANPITALATRAGVYNTTTSVSLQATEMSGDALGDADYVSLIVVGTL